MSSILHAEKLTIFGSTTSYPLVSKAAKAFMEKSHNLEIEVSSTGPDKGIQQLLNEQVDLAISSRYLLKKEIEHAASNGIHLVPFQIA